jgi:hypothetical protein
MQVLYLSGDGDPLWFSTGKGSDELIPTGELFSTFYSPGPLFFRLLIWSYAGHASGLC